MTETREFPLGAIITVVDGRVVAPVGDIHELLEWMSGRMLFTHQLPRVSEEARDSLIAQFLGIEDVIVPDGIDTWEDVEAFLAPHIARWGARVPVQPMAADDHTDIDPIPELQMMRPDLSIAVIRVDKERDAPA